MNTQTPTETAAAAMEMALRIFNVTPPFLYIWYNYKKNILPRKVDIKRIKKKGGFFESVVDEGRKNGKIKMIKHRMQEGKKWITQKNH